MTSPRERALKRTGRFARDLKLLPDEVKKDAFAVALKLRLDVFDRDIDIRPLTGFKGYYRVVVAKDFRLILSFDPHNVYLRRIAHRKDIYRKLEL